MPAGWPRAFARIKQSGDAATAAQAMALAVTFGDAQAVEICVRSWRTETPLDQRQSALAGLLKVRDAGLAPTLQGLFGRRRHAVGGAAGTGTV